MMRNRCTLCWMLAAISPAFSQVRQPTLGGPLRDIQGTIITVGNSSDNPLPVPADR
jgi:hypothetical protein